jgi:hypothetical protein
MNRRFRHTGALLIAVLFLAGIPPACRAPAEGTPIATLVLTGGTIHTLDPGLPVAEAIAIRGDRVLAVGKRAEIERLAGPATERIDLAGTAAFPGFVDAHAHVGGLGRKLATLDVTGTSSYDEVCARVSRAASDRPPGSWITGRGWDQNDWPDPRFPEEGPLSRAAPDHPVVLTRVDGHAILANRRAIELAGIDRSTPDPPGGKIHRDSRGDPTGVFLDDAIPLVTRHVPPADRAEKKRRIRLAIRECVAKGLTGVHDAGVDRETVCCTTSPNQSLMSSSAFFTSVWGESKTFSMKKLRATTSR